MPSLTTTLYDLKGRRKYLTHSERMRFLAGVESLPQERKLFCLVLLFTGCRISEALQLTVERIDGELSQLVLKTLKRRNPDEQRAVPIPASLATELIEFTSGKKGVVWPFSRRTGWRIIKTTMMEVQIHGIQACPKGLRHGFGIANAENNVPISKTQVWMGHANIETTMIYQNAVGEEERMFAERTWLGC